MSEYINPTGDTPHVQCTVCGWWVPRGKHTWVECSSLIRVSGKLHLFDEQRQEVPQAFYDAWKDIPDDKQ